MKHTQSPFCPQCGSSIVSNQRFCHHCGVKLATSDSRAFTSATTSPLSDTHSHKNQALAPSLRKWKLHGSEIPPGFTLRKELKGHEGIINQVTWLADGMTLATISSSDNTIRLWNTKTGRLLETFKENLNYNLLRWTDERSFTPGDITNIYLDWNENARSSFQELKVLAALFYNSASHDGHVSALADDYSIHLWNLETGKDLSVLEGHTGSITSVTWSPDDQIIASGSEDSTVYVWETKTGRSLRLLEGHTAGIIYCSFSSDGQLFASKSFDGTIRLWHVETWETVAILEEPVFTHYTGLAFCPHAPILATLSEDGQVIYIWDLDLDVLFGAISTTSIVRYSSAKVVLVGDSGVGKSGLGLVLTGQPFTPTESTHGRRVWSFDSREVELNKRLKEVRETLLWDLAGQPGYRLIHQLHLNEVTVALVVFDARSETDPFAGVNHWDRALRLAQRLQGSFAPPMKKYLVEARTDRGGSGVSRMRIDSLVRELKFDGYFETSARDGRNIPELADAIREAILWEALPKVTSTDLFQLIKAFLVAEKAAGRLLTTIDDLFSAFLRSEIAPSGVSDLRAQFEVCIGRVESRDLIRRLNFGKLVLLQPEILDAYASALVNAVKDEPDGLGSIAEERVRAGDFQISMDERLQDKEQEKLLLIAMVEDLLSREIALREQAYDGPYLVFPSQSTRENPDLPDPEGKTIIFDFEGPVLNIYATLAVRLSHSGLFEKEELWKNAVNYKARAGGTCGMFLHNIGEGRGELTLFFDKVASEETCFHFEEYIFAHLRNRALPETIKRRRIFVCNNCGFVVPDQLVKLRSVRGLNWVNCPACEDQRIWLLDGQERLVEAQPSRIYEMDHLANKQRDLEAAKSILQGKIEMRDYDVFLCHNHDDKPLVKKIGEQLKNYGFLPWLDEWELQPGLPWQSLLEQQIQQIKAAAVFVGTNGIGPWQDMELATLLRQFVKRKCPVIPVILSNCTHLPSIPVFLESMTWVDFRQGEPDPMERLIWGITGERRSIRHT